MQPDQATPQPQQPLGSNSPDPQPVQQPAPIPQTQGSSTTAVIGLILTVLLAPVGLVISIMARKKAKQNNNASASTLALIGIIVGSIFSFLVIAGFTVGFLSAGQKGAQQRAGAASVESYMRQIASGNCDEAWEFVDTSSPYFNGKEGHDTDCADESVQTVAKHVVDVADSYTYSSDDDLISYTYTITGAGGSAQVTVVTNKGKIYQISLGQ